MNRFFISAGFLFFGFGMVGVVVPLLPTTPLLLVASICFAKGSRRFNDWFKSTTAYRKHLEHFERDRAMKTSTKLAILIPVVLLLLLAFWAMPNPYARFAVALAILIKLYYFLFRIKTIPEST